MRALPLLAAALGAAADAPVADEAFPITRLLIALGLLAASLALLVLEFFIVSGGLIAVLAGIAAVAAIFEAFAAGDAAGWSFLIAAPALAVAVLTWGVRRVQRTRLAVQAEITADAGYHHVAEQLGVRVGSTGSLVTAAYPTGRARFAGGELDVTVRGAVAAKGAEVEVVAIEGPTVFVSARRSDR